MTTQPLSIEQGDVRGEIVSLAPRDANLDALGFTAFTDAGGVRVLALQNVRVVTPIRAEDYPVLAAIWDNEEDDHIFATDDDL